MLNYTRKKNFDCKLGHPGDAGQRPSGSRADGVQDADGKSFRILPRRILLAVGAHPLFWGTLGRETGADS